jgi:ribosomal protein L21
VTPTTNLAFTLVANSLNELLSSSGKSGTVEVVLVDVATAVVVNSTVVDDALVVGEVAEPEPQATIRRLVPKTKVARRKRNL